MVFVEIFRLLVVVLGAIAGLQLGEHVHRTGWAPLTGVFLGAAITYVAGGTIGRVVDHGISAAVGRLRSLPAAEVLAAAVVGTAGLLIGLAVGLPLLALVRSPVDLPAIGALAWVLCMLGVRVGALKGRDVARAAGIAHLLDPRLDQQLAGSLVADASALLDRQLALLGLAGLLAGGLAVPRFVVDEVRMLAESPDPLVSGRARQGLDTLAALRDAGVSVTVVGGAVPGTDAGDGDERLVAMARRLDGRVVTCSRSLAEAAVAGGVPAVDLRRLADDLAPSHQVGDVLAVDLVRSGRLPRQAVGYLPDGDMVVVNDAEHLVGGRDVAVVVSGVRRTTQGRMVFAHLAGSTRVPAPGLPA
ncbi:MAG: hypothetical protein M0Z63_02200 [Actinomycetota bacterium]|jgi:uncharacterized protein YacL|nr:hypothetical protein [Actinomycetota bacterium]